MARVLLVDDDPAIREVLGAYLRQEGYEVVEAADGLEALGKIPQASLVVLDLMLPRLSGWEVARELRRDYPELPVLMLTAKGEEEERIRGLDLGADDYVTKPFSPREVVARVKAVLRRANPLESAATVLRAGPLEIDTERVMARVGASRLELTPTEFRLLETLARTPGRAFTRQELLEAALPDSDALERVIDVHLKNLRKKLEAAGATGLLETVRGVGYRLWVE